MPLFQNGSAIIVVNEIGKILLEERVYRNKWCLPSGLQELGEITDNNEEFLLQKGAKQLKFFDLEKLSENLMDKDFIRCYTQYLSKSA